MPFQWWDNQSLWSCIKCRCIKKDVVVLPFSTMYHSEHPIQKIGGPKVNALNPLTIL